MMVEIVAVLTLTLFIAVNVNVVMLEDVMPQILLIQVQINHGHLHTGQLCRHFFFCQVTRVGAVTWDPNYTPGVDFLDHDFL